MLLFVKFALTQQLITTCASISAYLDTYLMSILLLPNNLTISSDHRLLWCSFSKK